MKTYEWPLILNSTQMSVKVLPCLSTHHYIQSLTFWCCCLCASQDEGTALLCEDVTMNPVKNSTLLDLSHAQDLALQQSLNLSSILGKPRLFIIHNCYYCREGWCISHTCFNAVLSIWKAVMLLCRIINKPCWREIVFFVTHLVRPLYMHTVYLFMHNVYI